MNSTVFNMIYYSFHFKGWRVYAAPVYSMTL
jgi:hypothetical protein